MTFEGCGEAVTGHPLLGAGRPLIKEGAHPTRRVEDAGGAVSLDARAWSRPGAVADMADEWAYCQYDALRVWGGFPADPLEAFPGDLGDAAGRRAVRIGTGRLLFVGPGDDRTGEWRREIVAVHRSWWDEAGAWLSSLSAFREAPGGGGRFWKVKGSKLRVLSPTGGGAIDLSFFGLDDTDGGVGTAPWTAAPLGWPVRLWRTSPGPEARAMLEAIRFGETGGEISVPTIGGRDE